MPSIVSSDALTDPPPSEFEVTKFFGLQVSEGLEGALEFVPDFSNSGHLIRRHQAGLKGRLLPGLF